MTKKVFMELLIKELEKHFPTSEYELKSDTFLKNNDTMRYGIIVRRMGGNIAPTVYIDHFYEDYCNKKNTIDEIAYQIYLALIGVDEQENSYYTVSVDFENCKEKIIYKLISKEKNAVYLSGIPHLPFLDMAIIFLIVHRLSDEGMESICITNELQEKWNVSTKELFELSKKNTPAFLPPIIDTMAHTIESFFGSMGKEILESDKMVPSIYILSNQYRINGATTLLYENLIQKLAEELKSNLYILPSSIHEILLLPDDSEKSLDCLSNMVKDINENHVREEEILSDHAYYYNRVEKRFFLQQKTLYKSRFIDI